VITLIIGIISDTHEKDSTAVKEFVEKNLKKLDILIHVGDFTCFKVLEALSHNFKLIGVQGNNDDLTIKQKLKEIEVLLVSGYKIGLYHGHGNGKNAAERALQAFKDIAVDIIIFGHSHMPLIQTKDRKLLINPGSPLVKRKERWYSFAILHIEENHINIELKMFESKLK
jgi:uncharacterized protein